MQLDLPNQTEPYFVTHEVW